MRAHVPLHSITSAWLVFADTMPIAFIFPASAAPVELW